MIKNPNVTITLALPTVFSAQQFLEPIESHFQKNKKLRYKYQRTAQRGEALLNGLLTEDKSTAYAAISALGYGLPGREGWWFRADPVEFMVDAGNVCLLGRDHLFLREDEALHLVNDLNTFLQDDKLTVHMGSSHEWFLQVLDSDDLMTYPLFEVIAHDIKLYLPKGSKQKKWHRLLTEFQMLLFNHSVNHYRQRMQSPCVNGIWLWGEGSPNTCQIKNYSSIWTDSSYVKGMLSLNKLLSSSHSVENFLKVACEQQGDHLITMDHYLYGLEQCNQIIAHLLEKTHNRQISSLTLCFGNGEVHRWELPRIKLFSFVRLGAPK